MNILNTGKAGKNQTRIFMSQCQTLLDALRRAGPCGLASMDIIHQCHIVNVTGRVSDLRDAGHAIETRREQYAQKTIWRFVLVQEKLILAA
jgi:Helix-turn-helix domain